MVDEYVVVEPLEKIRDGQIGLLLAYRLAGHFEQLSEMPHIGGEPREAVFGDVRAHLDITEACNPQIRNNLNGAKVDARRGELSFKPVGETLDRFAKRGGVRPEFRVDADLPQMEEEGQIRRPRVAG